MNYIGVEDAREREGLRLVLTTGVPGPWGEAAKSLFHVKGLEFVAVSQRAGDPNESLRAWTGQTSAPVAVSTVFPKPPPLGVSSPAAGVGCWAPITMATSSGSKRRCRRWG